MVRVYDGAERRPAEPLQTGITHERRHWEAGVARVAGVDEVGRGALAGPVVAAAVILPPSDAIPPALAEVTDSKLLTPQKREALYPLITAHAVAWAVGAVPADEIDRIGIAPATRAAMAAAIAGLGVAPQVLLIDFLSLPDIDCPQEPIVKGDIISLSIAAASIVAKVTRDTWMVQAEESYPGYGLAQHKGYATEQHLVALQALGPCPIHRHCFEPIAGRRPRSDERSADDA